MSEEKQVNLPAIIEKSGIETEQALIIQGHFEKFIEQVKEWGDKAFKINITSLDQKFEIAEANKAYKIVKEVRLNAEAMRKELKEDSLRKGKLIDGIAKFVFEKIEPIEEHLEKQAKFEKLEKERLDIIMVQERSQELLKWVEDISIFNLATMPEDTFQKLVADSKTLFETRKAEADKLEKERLKKEEDNRIENERIRKENEDLKKQKEIDDKKIEDERKKAEDLQKKEDERIAKEEQAKKDKLEADRIEKERLEKIERDKKNAPDKEKLNLYAESIKNLVAPTGISVAALEIVKIAEKELLKVAQQIKDSLKLL